MQVHEISQPITPCKAWKPRAGSAVYRFWTGCHVDVMAVVWQNHIGKNIKITFKLRPSVHNRIANFFMEAWRYEVGTIVLVIVPPFSYKDWVPLTALLPKNDNHPLARTCWQNVDNRRNVIFFIPNSVKLQTITFQQNISGIEQTRGHAQPTRR